MAGRGSHEQKIFDLLATRFDDPDAARVKAARELVWTLLSEASMQKAYHGKKMLTTPALGQLWDQSDHGDADCAEGTFASLLRYGSVHFEQTRKVEFVKAPKVDELDVLHVGNLEPSSQQ